MSCEPSVEPLSPITTSPFVPLSANQPCALRMQRSMVSASLEARHHHGQLDLVAHGEVRGARGYSAPAPARTPRFAVDRGALRSLVSRAMTTLVTGGAGYVGSSFVERLAEGEPVVVLDDLPRPPRRRPLRARRSAWAGWATASREARRGGARRRRARPLRGLHRGGRVGRAAPLLREQPRRRRLLGALVASGVGRVIFSSTAAVYGRPRTARSPRTRLAPGEPVRPHEARVRAVPRGRGGGDRSAARDLPLLQRRGRDGRVPRAPRPRRTSSPTLRAARGELPALRLFGTDFPTRDGTCRRLRPSRSPDAHWRALGHRSAGSFVDAQPRRGVGHTVREVIAAVARVTGRRFRWRRRGGGRATRRGWWRTSRGAGEALRWRPTQNSSTR